MWPFSCRGGGHSTIQPQEKGGLKSSKTVLGNFTQHITFNYIKIQLMKVFFKMTLIWRLQKQPWLILSVLPLSVSKLSPWGGGVHKYVLK